MAGSASVPDNAFRHVTVSDVARAAGVTPGTVSKALNGNGNLRPETRERVTEIAAEMGFVRNELARSLLKGRSYTVGLISTDSFSRFAGPVALGAEGTLGEGEISVFLCDGQGDKVRERHYVKTLLARRVDGIIVTGRRHESREPLLDTGVVPVVYALSPSLNPTDTSVVVDDEQGARIAIEHLASLGRNKTGHITGPERHLSARLRATGAVDVINERGLELAGGRVFWGEWSERWGREAARSLLVADPTLDSIFCGSDQIARGAVEALRELGRSVPNDVSIVGFDNWDVIAEATRPPLTTIDMNLSNLGHQAAVRLIDAIEGRGRESGVSKHPCSLVFRESTVATRG